MYRRMGLILFIFNMPLVQVNTFDQRSPSMPGTFYDIFIDQESGLMKGVRFDISQPGMVVNHSQPLGPDFHVFGEYRKFYGLALPTF